MAIDDQLIDKRILKRSLASGKVEQFEFDDMITNLPDVSGNILGPEDGEDEASARDDAEAPSESVPDTPAIVPVDG